MTNLFSKKLKHRRKILKLTLEEVGDLIGSGKSYIWDMENSENSNPSAKTVLKLSKLFGVSLEYLVDERCGIGHYGSDDKHYCNCQCRDVLLQIQNKINFYEYNQNE